MGKIKVCVTGNIGSGKTTVCKIFQVLGVPVYFADRRAIELVQITPGLVRLYCQLFGEDVFENGVLQRERVASVIFSNPELLCKVQEAVHPVVRVDFLSWANAQINPVVIIESAILLESGGRPGVDKVVMVTAPESIRVQRAMNRDKVSGDLVLSRMKHQWPEEIKAKLSDHIIYADENQLVTPQVIKLYRELLAAD